MIPSAIITVVAELDDKGLLTGQAYDTRPEDADKNVPYANYSTFGTWEAFRKQMAAQPEDD